MLMRISNPNRLTASFFSVSLAILILGSNLGLAETLIDSAFNGSDDEAGFTVIQTDDGGYILTGLANTAVGLDVLLLKVDANGTEVWNRTFGGPGNDVGISIKEAGDGNYIIAGWTNSSGSGGNDVLLIKVDSQGDELWNRTFGGEADDEGRVAHRTSDGGYIIIGQTASFGAGGVDMLFIKTDNEGSELWNRTFGRGGDEVVNSASQTMDGGYAIAGWTNSTDSGEWAISLTKTDENGAELWNRTFSGDADQRSFSFQQTKNGGYIITGVSATRGNDVLLVRSDGYGREVWRRTFGGEGDDQGRCVRQTKDGGYAIVGWTNSTGSEETDVLLIRTDPQGRELWTKTFGEESDDRGRYLFLTNDGGYVLSGETRSYGSGDWDALLIKVDAEGTLEWMKSYGR